jgi:hypothetical protein
MRVVHAYLKERHYNLSGDIHPPASAVSEKRSRRCAVRKFKRKGRKVCALESAKKQNLCALGVFLFALFAFNHPFLERWKLR